MPVERSRPVACRHQLALERTHLARAAGLIAGPRSEAESRDGQRGPRPRTHNAVLLQSVSSLERHHGLPRPRTEDPVNAVRRVARMHEPALHGSDQRRPAGDAIATALRHDSPVETGVARQCRAGVGGRDVGVRWPSLRRDGRGREGHHQRADHQRPPHYVSLVLRAAEPAPDGLHRFLSSVVEPGAPQGEARGRSLDLSSSVALRAAT